MLWLLYNSSTLVRAPPSYTSDILWFIKKSESEFLLGIFTCISTAEKNSWPLFKNHIDLQLGKV